MANTIPFIRAANVLPLVRWLEVNCFETMAYLEAADSAYWFARSPLDPVPTLSAIQLIGDMARDHGPDIGARIETEASLTELGFIGEVALGASTPTEALRRIQFAISLHSSHEMLRNVADDRNIRVAESLTFKTDPASLHAVHVMFSSFMQQLCGFTGMQRPFLSRVELCAHPEYGARYLEGHFGCEVVEAKASSITITIDRRIAGNRFRNVARDRIAQLASRAIPRLAEDQTRAASVRGSVANFLDG